MGSVFGDVTSSLTIDEILNSELVGDENEWSRRLLEFNEGEGDLIYDLSSNQNHGTINGATWILEGSHLIISGVLDLDLPESGNSGKAVIVQALADIPDLSSYGLGVANNGGGSDGIEYNFPAQSLSQGENLWIIRDAQAYSNYFGAEMWTQMSYVIDESGWGVGQNGDDAVELFLDGELVDIFGFVDVDGTGESWEYKDAWAHRNCEARIPSVIFSEDDWSIATPNCTDTDNFGLILHVPIHIGTVNQPVVWIL